MLLINFLIFSYDLIHSGNICFSLEDHTKYIQI